MSDDWRDEEIAFLRGIVKGLAARIARLEADRPKVETPAGGKLCMECPPLGHYGECDEHANEGFV